MLTFAELTADALAFPDMQAVPVPASPWARRRVAITYRWRHGRWPSLDRPVRFTVWVQWRKLNDRRVDLALLTDKYHSKSIAQTRLPTDYLIPTLWLGLDLPEVAPWPMPFVVKANHGCNQYIIVRTGADYIRARKLAPRWLAELTELGSTNGTMRLLGGLFWWSRISAVSSCRSILKCMFSGAAQRLFNSIPGAAPNIAGPSLTVTGGRYLTSQSIERRLRA